ncbi:hypothetical protein GAGA_4028 [Paraglaciecola agarilytica NO2]|uniref:Transposase DDE domain-containing protein n=1 Tax=Paraglaciecola agarilytica NO2 TaxID=1125747 RepID=A0ABQ0IBV2_9ALTE|nr:hypothetical protein GAGA_4028 [Paraglaciecola agarilytica NO2]
MSQIIDFTVRLFRMVCVNNAKVKHYLPRVNINGLLLNLAKL